MAGWISVHRQLQNHWLWKDKPFAKGQAWIDLLLLAGYEDKNILSKGESVDLKRGSFLTSEQDLMDRWGWSRKKVRCFLELLIKEQMIEPRRSPKGTILMISNYDTYQTLGTTKDTSPTLGTSELGGDKGPTKGPSLDKVKEGPTLGPSKGPTKDTSPTLGTSGLGGDKGPTKGPSLGPTLGTLLISLNKSNKSIREEERPNPFKRPPETPEQAELRHKNNAEFIKMAEDMAKKGVGVK
ncbi:MAG: hypothetical protein APF81_13385 [Desulfosporosinus sp. BRH_c37]|nr:MAG: hypothetical protein APF81_13385 [Desulfosporosinus sp. BRH_c37]